jgi:hypothetical protein
MAFGGPVRDWIVFAWAWLSWSPPPWQRRKKRQVSVTSAASQHDKISAAPPPAPQSIKREIPSPHPAPPVGEEHHAGLPEATTAQDTKLYNHTQNRLGPRPGRPTVTTADPLDLDTFCARVGCAYVKHGLCPPFALREAAAAWAADGVALSHCLTAIEEHLRDHAASCRSGSGDRLFGWLDKIIRHSWNKSHSASRAPPAHLPRR